MSRAEITSEINDLVKQGNMRDAYAKFEELPIIDQIGISLSPGVGDALAVYETGEFGRRASERFSEDLKTQMVAKSLIYDLNTF